MSHRMHICSGTGCPECAKLERRIKHRLTWQSSISIRANRWAQNCRAIHGTERYEYSKAIAVFTSTDDRLPIHCNQCGMEFLQKAAAHQRGQGCPKCKATPRTPVTADNLILKAQRKHGEHRYSYLSKPDSYDEKVSVKCNTCLQPFDIIMRAHICGQGCPICAQVSFQIKRTQLFAASVPARAETWAKRVAARFGEGRFDLSDAILKYQRNDLLVPVKCNRCQSIFAVRPKDFTRSRGCSQCARASAVEK